ncbi:MAG: hypothetical protein KJO87_06090 [Acidimicrobiia bacterium]|nr:hypothetical protein [Acidimicrobiia bacterium]
MTTERRVLQHLRALNPITDERTIDLPETSSTAFLEAIETRRRIMSVRIERPVEKPPKKRTRRRNSALALGAAVIVAAVGVSAWLIGDEPSDVGTPLSVAEKFIEAGLTGGGSEGLHLLTPQFLEEQQDFQNAFAAWNDRYERVGPCEENPLTQMIRCVVLHHTDFHAAGGLSPFEQTMDFVVNDAGQIGDIRFSVEGWFTKIAPFNSSFMAWLDEAHPEEAAKMSDTPMGPAFNSEDARIALQYVDEFVAQSDIYPIGP